MNWPSRGRKKSPILNVGEKSQPFGLINDAFLNEYSENPRILRFFKTGTPPAKCVGVRRNGSLVRLERRNTPMFFSAETTNKVFAAAFSLVLSTAVMAATIIPGSPALFA